MQGLAVVEEAEGGDAVEGDDEERLTPIEAGGRHRGLGRLVLQQNQHFVDLLPFHLGPTFVTFRIVFWQMKSESRVVLDAAFADFQFDFFAGLVHLEELDVRSRSRRNAWKDQVGDGVQIGVFNKSLAREHHRGICNRYLVVHALIK